MANRGRSWWGWGRVERALSDSECAEYAEFIPGRYRSSASLRGFGSAAVPVDTPLAEAVEIARNHGATVEASGGGSALDPQNTLNPGRCSASARPVPSG
ncbi:hypothetical protein [Allosalinactinospora lopnorensis]|uniref:hypothetical protein n=1 Tax=Allosalinactinospora lopnorensis TaxID=1352348 RepID=UPI000623D919|nr:hypothetical protein [Allosalinactinospora lopnorensis]